MSGSSGSTTTSSSTAGSSSTADSGGSVSGAYMPQTSIRHEGSFGVTSSR